MTTEELIRRLAADPRPAPPLGQTLAARGLPALLAAFLLMAFGWGLRPGLPDAFADPVTLLKLVLPVLTAVAAITGALRLARPDGQAGGVLGALALVGLVAFGLVVLGLARTTPEAWGAAFRGETLVACLLSIPLLALLPTLALLAALRRGASLAPTVSGALAGLGGGAAAAAIYALHCPEDNPLFFVTWYGMGMFMVMGAGAFLARRWLRW